MERTSLDYFDLLSNFQVGLEVAAFYAVACLLTYLFFLVLIRLSRRVERRKEPESLFTESLSILGRFLNEGHGFSSLYLFLACSNLCLWHTLLFLTNNIKTNKVTIDTSEIVLNSYNVFQNQRVACFLKHEDEMKIAMDSPKGEHIQRSGSSASRLIDRLFQAPSCIGCFMRRPSSTRAWWRSEES